MKIVTNPKKIQRNYKIGLYTSLGSLLFLFAAVGLTLTTRTDLVNLSFLSMAVGLILSQVGVYFANRYGKSPRVDERITAGLKGLDDRYTLYHYVGPVPHILTGPAGVWVLAPQYHSGVISFEKDRYRQRGVGFFARVVGQEGLSRPEMEAKAYEEDLHKFVNKALPEEQVPPIHSVIVFTNPKASVQVEGTPIPTMHVEKLKDFIRRKTKEQPASLDKVRHVQDLLPKEDL